LDKIYHRYTFTLRSEFLLPDACDHNNTIRRKETMKAFRLPRKPGVIVLLIAALFHTACSAATATSAPTAAVEAPTPSTVPSDTPQQAAAPPTPTEPAAEASGDLLPGAQCASAGATLTPASAEGPFYTPDTPQRNNLVEPDMEGTPLILVGLVLDGNCQPVSGAWLDFWQTDAAGNYDNQGYNLRGHQFSAADGSYRLETILPAAYGTGGGSRPPHIHVKVQAPGAAVLTTQLYFPTAEALNAQDSIFNDALLVDMQNREDGSVQARFDFIIETGP
jgi:protocatechuate 3,4-dioxygenase beta subunit